MDGEPKKSNEFVSIPAHLPPSRLPDFRNQGIWLRVLLAANGLMLLVALAGNRQLAQLPREIGELAALVEPVLLLSLALLFALSPRLQRLPQRLAAPGVVALVIVVAIALDRGLAGVFGTAADWRVPLAVGAGTAALLYWLDLRARACAPALAEARLAALTARIRPHFFFNSLNAVLGIMREDSRRAEAALEELADLFRALMRDNTELTLLSDEIGLARKYLDIERLRLGERLQVRWEVDACPPDALAPPLLLQPLLENAVYHGIEPTGDAGEIHVRISTSREEVQIEIDNPWTAAGAARHGNQMALDNLRERLQLFYDLEARLDHHVNAGRYRVRVVLPIRKQR